MRRKQAALRMHPSTHLHTRIEMASGRSALAMSGAAVVCVAMAMDVQT